MLIYYTNNKNQFRKRVKDCLKSDNIPYLDFIIEKTISLKLYRTAEEDGFILNIYYESLSDSVYDTIMSVNLEDSVKSFDIQEGNGCLKACLILDSLDNIKEIFYILSQVEIKYITCTIETKVTSDSEDIIITQILTDIINKSDILSLCTAYISKNNELDKHAFYMFLASLCANFLDMDIICQIYLDFVPNFGILKEYIKIFTSSLPTDDNLSKLLIYPETK